MNTWNPRLACIGDGERKRSLGRKTLLLYVALIGVALTSFSSKAQAATFELCVKIDVRTTDSGLTANGIKEDYWVNANNPTQYLVTGRGFRVKVTQGTWSATYDSDPITGCFSFSRNLSSGFGIRVYGYATDSAGNHVRIHDAGLSTSSWYPGKTYSSYWANQTLSTNSKNTYVLNGRANDRWTTIAAAAFALRRFHAGISDVTISIGFSEGNCNDSGSIHGNAENYIESNNAHLIRIGRCADATNSDAREKMIITHELGHALARLYYGYNGDDQPRNQTYNPPGTPGNGCENVSSYGMNSLEWNSQTFKEAFADFYSAAVWNNKASRGTYTYRGNAFDLEKWDSVTNQNTAGGYTLNVCNSNVANVSTKGDWLRFFWDWYTAACTNQPSHLDMMRLYRAVRENNRTGEYSLSISNYDNATLYAIENSVPGLSSCERNIAVGYMNHNNGG